MIQGGHYCVCRAYTVVTVLTATCMTERLPRYMWRLLAAEAETTDRPTAQPALRANVVSLQLTPCAGLHLLDG